MPRRHASPPEYADRFAPRVAAAILWGEATDYAATCRTADAYHRRRQQAKADRGVCRPYEFRARRRERGPYEVDRRLVEPGQRPEFEEISVVLSGRLRVEHEGGVIDVNAGQAVVCEPGEWVRYSTPDAEGADYVAICRPAFSPATVHRDSAD